MQVPWDHILSVTIGGWVTAFVVKLLITKSIRELERVTRKLEDISSKMGILETRLETMERMKHIVFEHDRKIVEIETRHRNHGNGRLKTTPI